MVTAAAGHWQAEQASILFLLRLQVGNVLANLGMVSVLPSNCMSATCLRTELTWRALTNAECAEAGPQQASADAIASSCIVRARKPAQGGVCLTIIGWRMRHTGEHLSTRTALRPVTGCLHALLSTAQKQHSRPLAQKP